MGKKKNRNFMYVLVALCAAVIIEKVILINLADRYELSSNLRYSIDGVLTIIIVAAVLSTAIRDKFRMEAKQEKAMHMALHDSLTGLPNRTLLDEEFKKLLKANEKQKSNLAVMFLDLDKFKQVNDTLGHEIGDKLLRAVAKRLKNCIREKDILCRLGGDEFIILFSNVNDVRDVEVIAQKILDIFKSSFSIENYTMDMTTSIGISLCPANGTEVDGLIKNADLAMYKSKLNGKNRYEFYTEDLSLKQAEVASDVARIIRM